MSSWPSSNVLWQFNRQNTKREVRNQMDNDDVSNSNEVNNNGTELDREEMRGDLDRRQVIEDVSRELARIGDHFQAMYTSSWHLGMERLGHHGRGN